MQCAILSQLKCNNLDGNVHQAGPSETGGREGNPPPPSRFGQKQIVSKEKPSVSACLSRFSDPPTSLIGRIGKVETLSYLKIEKKERIKNTQKTFFGRMYYITG